MNDEENKFYLHSACCNGHWKLVHLYDEVYELYCVNCETPAGTLTVTSKKQLKETSPCCNAHWEIVYHPDTQQYSLECEECDMPAKNLVVNGPAIEGECQCSECQRPEKLN